MKMSTLITAAIIAATAGIASAAAPDRAAPRATARNAERPAAEQRAAARGQREEQRAARAGRGDGANLTPEQRVDKRQQTQEKRIEAGVKKGQLTPDEVSKLRILEDNIQTLETQFTSDGSLTRNEARQLGKALNEASLQIWAGRHDTEGNQKPVVRLGKNVYALDELTTKIESGQMTRGDARKFLGDFKKMAHIKTRLSSDTLTDEQRTRLQNEYTELFNRYFTTRA